MLTLTEIYLMKSFKKLAITNKPHKYIRRWFENGAWRYEYPKDDGSEHYIYETPSGKVATGKFGVFLTRFKNNPAGAFRELFKRKSGQALDVVSFNLPVVEWDDSINKYVERQEFVLTGIDLVYGNNNRGIKHILRNHFIKKNDFSSVKECERELSNTLLGFQNGTRQIINKEFQHIIDNDSIDGITRIGKWILLDNRGYRVVIDVEVQQVDNEKYYRHFVLTSYDNTRGAEEKVNTEEESVRRAAIMNQKTY